jgi:predicted nuclease of predicted toxin-antitoxin system
MKILIDMNLSPIWADYFTIYQIESIHWSNVGQPNAKDKEIFDYARENSFVVFTNDLDFSAILASSRATFPSVIQVRTQNLLPDYIGETIIELLSQFDEMIDNGCLLTFDENKTRTRILPLF